MPAIVSPLGMTAYALLSGYVRHSSAVSEVATRSREAVGVVAFHVEKSEACFGPLRKAQSELRALAAECFCNGWDGEDAVGLQPSAVVTAEQILRCLPGWAPFPEFAPEPDGSISLDWIQSRNRLFSLSVGKTHRLAYSWLNGSDKGYGVASFDGREVPSMVLEGIRSVLLNGSSSVRA